MSDLNELSAENERLKRRLNFTIEHANSLGRVMDARCTADGHSWLDVMRVPEPYRLCRWCEASIAHPLTGGPGLSRGSTEADVRVHQ